MTSIDTSSSPSFTAPEMPAISPTTSNDASNSEGDELITTPRRSMDDTPASAAVPSPQIVGLPTPGSGPSKPRFNFASLNKLNKTPPSPGGPKYDGPSPPSSPTLAPSAPAPSPKKAVPYSRPAPAPAVQSLRPMTPANPNPKINMPKSQPLSRALFTKLSENGSGAGLALGSKKVAKTQKLIVPKKSFQTTFELPLTSSEFARRWYVACVALACAKIVAYTAADSA